MTALLIPGQALRPLQIAGTPVEDATVGEVYAGFTVTASGGRPPYVFSVDEDGGQLPDWTSFGGATGIVAPGTPDEAGVFADIILRVTDSSSPARTADLTPFTLTPVEGGGGEGDEITFMGEVVTFDGEPVTYTPME